MDLVTDWVTGTALGVGLAIVFFILPYVLIGEWLWKRWFHSSGDRWFDRWYRRL